LASLTRSSANVERLTADPALKDSLSNLALASQRLADSSKAVADVLTKPSTASNIDQTLAAVRQSAEDLEKTTAHLRQVLTDTGLSEDLRQSMRNLAEASEKAKQSAGKAETILAAGERIASSASHLEARIRQDIYYTTESDDWNGALNLEINAGSTGRSLIAGVEDVGQGNHLNLKIARDFAPNYRLQGGLHRGQMGIGLVSSPIPRVGLALDLYNPRQLAADFWARYELAHGLSLVLGEEHIFRGNDVRGGVTLRY